MIVYLAGFETLKRYYEKPINDVYFLSSFFEHKGKRGEIDDYICGDRHILDSGAFSAFSNIESAKKIDWDDYIKKYADFIIKTGNKLFFELDIDVIVGLKKVEDHRKYLEDRTGMQSIPVWHKARGKDYWLQMIEQYKYVAIGGIVSREITTDQYKYFPWFINEAHKKGCKVHGLGFTRTDLLQQFKFDSVDSTSWISGARYGQIYQFDGTRMIHTNPPKGMRAVDHKITNTHNFDEWVKFQKYALKNL